ncbi:MAG: redox-sensing transcriptional repressor Rex [Clostridiales bacterium]|nr:redox-sensing transcriptional repressor Rex [Clostridiales bacterium]
MMRKKVSESVINRLPRYYRYLNELDSGKVDRISSRELSRRMHVTASQIRQDLNCFGGFGQQGYGYNVRFLKESIEKILGLDRGYRAILVGAGNMGKTFAINTKFESRGFKLIGIFDTDPKKFGTMIGIHKVLPYSRIREFISENKPQMAILAIPKTAMHEVANQLISYGIKAFMNFSYTELSTPDDIAVENVHLGDSLMRLSYKLTEKQNSEKTVKKD